MMLVSHMVNLHMVTIWGVPYPISTGVLAAPLLNQSPVNGPHDLAPVTHVGDRMKFLASRWLGSGHCGRLSNDPEDGGCYLYPQLSFVETLSSKHLFLLKTTYICTKMFMVPYYKFPKL